jgi:hypothetical protein
MKGIDTDNSALSHPNAERFYLPSLLSTNLPERALTNDVAGIGLVGQVGAADWSLRRFQSRFLMLNLLDDSLAGQSTIAPIDPKDALTSCADAKKSAADPTPDAAEAIFEKPHFPPLSVVRQMLRLRSLVGLRGAVLWLFSARPASAKRLITYLLNRCSGITIRKVMPQKTAP